jgi:hypothetical protein
MVIPKGLVTVIGLLILGFLVCFSRTIRLKTGDSKYRKLDSLSSGKGTSANPSTSYQNTNQEQYGIPASPKALTYCVVDGRLVDS